MFNKSVQIKILINTEASNNKHKQVFPVAKTARLRNIPDIISFRANFAYDGLFSTFEFSTRSIIAPFVGDITEVYFINDDGSENYIVSGYILKTAISHDKIFTCSCVSLTWILSKTIVSPSAEPWTFRDISPFALANRLAEPFGLRFEIRKDANAANAAISKYEVGNTATAADVILDVCRASGLYINVQIGSINPMMLHIHNLQDIIGRIDLPSSVSPIYNFNIEYSSENLYAARIGKYLGNESGLDDRVLFSDDNAPFPTAKIIEARHPDFMQSAVERAREKDFVSSCKLNFTAADYKINRQMLKTAATITVNAPEYGIQNTDFFITDIEINFDGSGIRSNISACLESARFGVR